MTAYHPDSSTSSIFAILLVSGIIFVVLLLLFECCRGQKEIYAPRLRSRKSRSPPDAPSSKPFGWIFHTLSVSDEDTLRMIGMDAFVHLRFLWLCMKITLIAGVSGMIILVPIYVTSPFNPDNPGVNRWTMGNVHNNGGRLWASAIFMWIYTIIFLRLLRSEYESFSALRQKYLVEGDVNMPTQASYSVLVENIPVGYRSKRKLKQLFDKLFPNAIHSVSVPMNTKIIDKLVAERKSIVAKLEVAIAVYEESHHEKRVEIKLNKKGKPALCGGKTKVDAIDYYTAEIFRLDTEIDTLQAKIKNFGDSSETTKSYCSGFVTYTSKTAQTIAYQVSTLSSEFPTMSASPAPCPAEVIWSNISVTTSSTKHASNITHIFYYLGLLFWGLIIAFIGAVSNLAMLSKYLPFVKLLDPVSYALLAGYLPVIVLAVFLSLIPVFISLIATYGEGRKTRTDVQMEVFKWFFAYCLANVFLTLLSGSLFNSLAAAIGNPGSIITLIGHALPNVSVFFINYILSQALGVPMMLIRLVPFIITNIYLKCFNQNKLTRRQIMGVFSDASVDYSTTLPGELYILCIVLVYWVITPLVPLVGWFYFFFLFLAYKHQYLYVFVPSIETGGKFWYGLFNRSMYGLMTASICFIVYMAIKGGFYQLIVVIPIPLVISYVWDYTDCKYRQFSLNTALSKAVEEREEGMEDALKQLVLTFDTRFYVQESLVVPPAVVEPYRISGLPLLTDQGTLNEVYHHPCPKEGSRVMSRSQSRGGAHSGAGSRAGAEGEEGGDDGFELVPIIETHTRDNSNNTDLIGQSERVV